MYSAPCGCSAPPVCRPPSSFFSSLSLPGGGGMEEGKEEEREGSGEGTELAHFSENFPALSSLLPDTPTSQVSPPTLHPPPPIPPCTRALDGDIGRCVYNVRASDRSYTAITSDRALSAITRSDLRLFSDFWSLPHIVRSPCSGCSGSDTLGRCSW